MQYLNRFSIKEFFLKLKSFSKFNLFINEPLHVNFDTVNDRQTVYRGNVSFSHNYEFYGKNKKLEIIEKKIINHFNKNTEKKASHIYIHLKNS